MQDCFDLDRVKAHDLIKFKSHIIDPLKTEYLERDFLLFGINTKRELQIPYAYLKALESIDMYSFARMDPQQTGALLN